MDEIQFTRDLLISNQDIVLISARDIIYAGIFDINDLFREINQALESQGYVKREKRTEELVTDLGKKAYIELRPYKYVSPEIKLLIKIKINLDQVTETKVQGRKFQQGNVRIGFDAWYMTNYKKRWVMRPWVYFLKGLINKYIYEWPEEKNSRNLLVSDIAAVYIQVKKLFKTYQPEAVKPLEEEEVMKEVEKEIGKERS